MARSSREKIALVVLALLVVLLGVCSCAYMSTANHWTVAATYVDDTVGSMDGYTVIVYPGTVVPAAEEEVIPVSENGLFGEPAADQDEGASVEDQDLLDESEEAIAGSVDSDYGERFLPLIDEIEKPAPDPLYVADVRVDYLSKGASVLSLDTANLARYAEPGLFIIDGKRIAVFSAETELTETRLNVYSQFVAQMDADVVMCLTPSLSYLPALSGIDMVVLTESGDGYTTIGSSKDGTYILSAPEVGSVGVILVTPNNVASSKVVDSL